MYWRLLWGFLWCTGHYFILFFTCLPFSNENLFKPTVFAQQLCKKGCTIVLLLSVFQRLVMVSPLIHNVRPLSNSPHMEKSCFLKTMHWVSFFTVKCRRNPTRPLQQNECFSELLPLISWLWNRFGRSGWKKLHASFSQWLCCDLYNETFSVPLLMLWYNLSQLDLYSAWIP